MANTIKVSVLGEVRDINKKLGQVNSQLGKTGKVASLAGKVVGAAFAGGAVIAGVKSVVSAASDAQQSIGATGTVFGKYADTVIKNSKKAAQQYGLDANTFRENSNLLGAIFSNQGVAQDKLAGSTKKMVGIGADLSATFGGTTTDAVGALGAAFKGEFDSLDKYGISLNATKINAELAARGQDKLTGSALDLAKQQVTTDLIMQQTNKTRGAFAKESETLAGQQQRLAAQFTNLKATIGTALLPVLTSAASFINATVLPTFAKWYDIFKAKVVPVIAELGGKIAATLLPVLTTLGNFITGTVVPALGNLVTFMVKWQNVIIPVVAGIVAMVAAFKTYQTILKVIKAVQMAFIAVQTALNIVMAANPIGIIVLALVGLGVALVVAYKKSETFRNIVDGAFKAVKNTAIAVWNAIKNATTATWNAIKNAITNPIQTAKNLAAAAWNAMKSAASAAWNAIKGAASAAWNGIKAAVSSGINTAKSVLSNGWNAAKTLTSNAWNAMKTAVSNGISGVIGFVQSIPGKITGALGNLGGLLTGAGKAIIQGLLDGINSMIGSVQSKLSELTNMIPNWKGPRNKDKTLLKDAGKLIMQGLVDGFTEGEAGVRDKLTKVTESIEKYYDKKIKNDDKAAAKAREAIKTLKDETAALEANAGKRKAVNDKLKEAKDALTALVTARNEENRTVKTNSELLADNLTALNEAKSSLAGLIAQRAKENGVMTTTNELLEDNASKLDAARSSLSSLKTAAADYIRTVANGFESAGNLVSLLPDEPKEGDLLWHLQSKVDKAEEFSALIQSLAAQGLNQTNLDQLIQGGVDAGLATAQALAAGGPAAIDKVNSLTAQLDAAGTNLGTVMSARFHTAGIDAGQATVTALESQRQALYDAGIASGQAAIAAIAAQRAELYAQGINAAQGLVDGFESMGDKLERAGDKLARKMVRAIRKALDINSPSRVFAKIGEQTTQGLVVGLNDTTGVEKATVNIGKAMERSFTTDLHASATASDGSAGGRNFTINVTAPATVDKAALGREVVAAITAFEKSGGRRPAL